MIESVTSVNYEQKTESMRRSRAELPEQIKQAEPVKQAEQIEPEEAVKRQNRDEYITGEKREPIGIYGVSRDENGEPRITRDSAEEPEVPENETVTANTDRVDREIKTLRDKKTELERLLCRADENTSDGLRRELERVSAELSQKDNDEYRRHNTVFTRLE